MTSPAPGAERGAAASGAAQPTAAVRRTFERIRADPRRGVWITLVDEAVACRAAAEVERRWQDGEELPLAGLTLAVKDNIDVAGLPTTAGCPAFGYNPAATAPAVQRLVDAGAVVVGKTNLDQFATGLVGTRSPYGAPACVADARRISGGSSSGSAVAVAAGLVDLGVGTDTAGSGRIPAAFNGIVGVKPTRGRIPTAGIVPACASLDCVSMFARGLAGAVEAVEIMSFGRPWPAAAPLAAPPRPRVAVPDAAALAALDGDRRAEFEALLDRVADLGWQLREVPFEVFDRAGALVYGGGLVAERYAAVGAFIDMHPDAVDPTVREIISAAGHVTGAHLAGDLQLLDELRVEAAAVLGGAVLLVPTAASHPTFDEVAAKPRATNSALGRFTAFCNPLDMCAVALPSGTVASSGDERRLPAGITLMAASFGDAVVADLAARLLGEPPPLVGDAGIAIAVCGAHLSGQPLNGELTSRGARLECATTTASCYRLHALDTTPPKPGLRRVETGGARVNVEVWRLPVAGFARFVEAVAAPMTIGTVALAGGREVAGFLCEPIALEGAPDITADGGWVAYLKGGSTGY